MMFQKDTWICPSNHHTYAIYIYKHTYILTDFRQNHLKTPRQKTDKNPSFLGIKAEDVTSRNSPAFCCISTKRSMWFESRATSTALRPWLVCWWEIQWGHCKVKGAFQRLVYCILSVIPAVQKMQETVLCPHVSIFLLDPVDLIIAAVDLVIIARSILSHRFTLAKQAGKSKQMFIQFDQGSFHIATWWGCPKAKGVVLYVTSGCQSFQEKSSIPKTTENHKKFLEPL